MCRDKVKEYFKEEVYGFIQSWNEDGLSKDDINIRVWEFSDIDDLVNEQIEEALQELAEDGAIWLDPTENRYHIMEY